MTKFKEGDRVKVGLSKPYTKKEIKELGCSPYVNGMTATVRGYGLKDLIELELDEELRLHPLNDQNLFGATKIYYEHEKNLERL